MSHALSSPAELSSLARIILKQLLRLRAENAIEAGDLELKLHRLEREELTPRGLKLVQRELPGGRLRFLITYTHTELVSEILEGESNRPKSQSIRRRLGQKQSRTTDFAGFCGVLRPAH